MSTAVLESPVESPVETETTASKRGRKPGSVKTQSNLAVVKVHFQSRFLQLLQSLASLQGTTAEELILSAVNTTYTDSITQLDKLSSSSGLGLNVGSPVTEEDELE